MGGNSFFNLTTMKKTLQIGFYILISLFIFTQSSCQDKTFDDESNSENSGNDSSDEGDDNEEGYNHIQKLPQHTEAGWAEDEDSEGVHIPCPARGSCIKIRRKMLLQRIPHGYIIHIQQAEGMLRIRFGIPHEAREKRREGFSCRGQGWTVALQLRAYYL